MKKKTNNFLSRFKIIFNRDKERLNSSVILIKGSLITCIILSIASGFIDITFFSGLSKSLLHIGTIPMFAAVLYTVISIGFISAKFWCAMKIGMIRELRSRLEARAFSWSNRLGKALIPWHIAHKFLIAISIITSLSLSVNSIGAGIRTMQQNIENMSNDAAQLIELNKSVNSGVKDKRTAAKSNITGVISARNDAKEEVERYYSLLVKYQTEYLNLSDEDKDGEIGQKIIQRIVKEIPGATARNAIYFNKADLQKSIQRTATSNEVDNSADIYQEAVDYDKAQIEDTIRAIADKDYKTPDGKIINFLTEDGKIINVQLAISRLQNGIAQWQNDTGDVGESSKIFTLVATYLRADTSAGGIGIAEWMLMIFIAIAGIVQEFLIAIFTPKAAIDRKLLSQVSQYLLWKNKEEKERFLISVYTDYVGDGIINQEEFEAKCKKCVSLMEETEDDIVYKYSSKKKKVITEKPTAEKIVKEGYSKKVDEAINEIDNLLGVK